MDPDPALPAQLYASLPIPLGTRSIRLLELDRPIPRRGHLAEDDPEPLRGRLRVVSLATSPHFTALSYVWGGEADPILDSRNSLKCGPYTLPLTKNCADALRVLRSRAGNCQVAIWVDALCINQADKAEKADQIPLMEEIYQWADPVFVWLGPGTEQSDRAFQAMRRVVFNTGYRRSIQSLPWLLGATPGARMRERRAYLWRNATAMDMLGARTDVKYGPGTDEPESDRKSLAADHQDIFSREWFTRAWTFQELVLAYNPVLLCGSWEISWIDYVSPLEIRIPNEFKASIAYSVGSVWYSVPRPNCWNGVPMRAIDGISDTPKKKQRKKDQADAESAVASPTTDNRSQASFRQCLETSSPYLCGPGRHRCHLSGTIILLRTLIFSIPFLILHAAIAIGIQFSGRADRMSLQAAIHVLLVPPSAIFLCMGVSMYTVQETCVASLSSCPTTDSSYPNRDAQTDTSTVLAGAMQLLRERRATHPNDMAYALYGILRALRVDTAGLTVDYAQPRGEVYHALFSRLLAWDAALACLLVDAAAGTLGPGVPSWVPDWANAPPHPWLAAAYAYRSRPTSATGRAPSRARVEGPRLRVTAVLWDVIDVAFSGAVRASEAEIVPGLDVESPVGAVVLGIVKWLAHVRREIRVDMEFESVTRVVVDVLLGSEMDDRMVRGVAEDIGAERADGRPRAQAFMDWYVAFSEAGDARFREDASMVAAAVDAMVAKESVRRYFIDCCGRLAGKRSLFFTSKRYAGTGPIAVVGQERGHTGDVVALIAGVSAPLVLRSQGGDEYRVVGPALIPGLMKGQAWEREGGESAARDLILV